MNELHLFAGAGGGILGGILLGHTCVCAVEIEPYCRKVLLQRQRDGIFPKFPIWDDVRTFDGKPWRGKVDIVAGGFPCKGISTAGDGTGLDHEESGLWREQARIIGDILPPIVFVENSPALTIRGGVRVLGDLAALGYDCTWGIISAADAIWSFGTPCLDHERARIWIYGQLSDADANGGRELQPQGSERDERRRISDGSKTDANSTFKQRKWHWTSRNWRNKSANESWWSAEPGLGRMVDGLANRVDRIRAIGNGQVPAVVERAWETLNPVDEGGTAS